jgi:hypothetical protein
MMNAKKSNRRKITLTMNNNFTIEDLIIEEVESIEKNDDFVFVVFVIFIIFFAFRIASILTIFSASRVVTDLTISRLTRKRYEFILKNNNSFLKSRNISFVMREMINEKMIHNQNSSRSRREAAIKSDVLKRNNFKHII